MTGNGKILVMLQKKRENFGYRSLPVKFSAQRSKKTRDFEKISIQNFAKIAYIRKLLGFSVPRPYSLGIDEK